MKWNSWLGRIEMKVVQKNNSPLYYGSWHALQGPADHKRFNGKYCGYDKASPHALTNTAGCQWKKPKFNHYNPMLWVRNGP